MSADYVLLATPDGQRYGRPQCFRWTDGAWKLCAVYDLRFGDRVEVSGLEGTVTETSLREDGCFTAYISREPDADPCITVEGRPGG